MGGIQRRWHGADRHGPDRHGPDRDWDPRWTARPRSPLWTPQPSRPYADFVPPPAYLLPVIEELLRGAPDDSASRRLDMSPRTFSRRVAELLDYLGCSSRFQGGAEAVLRGWVPLPARRTGSMGRAEVRKRRARRVRARVPEARRPGDDGQLPRASAG
ncbi:MAG: hypothetical protein ACRDT6_06270 [Micromonosporaceae bacterium]